MDERFRRHWQRWRKLTDEGKTPADFLASASDETLVELLAYAQEGTSLERNLIATELTNRISRLHRNVASHGDRVDELVDVDKAALQEADRADDHLRAASRAFGEETAKTRYSTERHEGDAGW